MIEQIGEQRGQLAATKGRLADDRAGLVRLILEKDERADTLNEALAEAQKLVRQYVPEGANLAKELIDERKSGSG